MTKHFEVRVVDEKGAILSVKHWPSVPAVGDIVYVHFTDYAKRMKVEQVIWDHVSSVDGNRVVVSLECKELGKENF